MVEPFAESNGDSCSAIEDMPADLKSLYFFVSDVVSYIAGFICRKLANSLKCAVCVSAMVSNPTFSEFIEQKYRGGLVYPGLDTEKLCKEVVELLVLEILLQSQYCCRGHVNQPEPVETPCLGVLSFLISM
ncbi:hypothetical protein AVEN_249378-1 [Araneus ventricosus]|uniref:Uncharacterized protein n=1 Tax=Araneus ventricosus TaxID=182803 RepID=A0A4Y2LHY5_ARAVE|nr:hypothetical protein AVEN_249378-1 [Araneus ventricosus]